MANPIAFKPPAVDPRTELNRRLEAAPTEHAEALLVAWDILQTAHDEGLLDAFHGLVSAKDTIFATLAEYAKQPEGIDGIRNFIALTRVFAALDPEMLDKFSKAVTSAKEEHLREQKPPGLWHLGRRAASEDSRRGLSFLTRMLSVLGQSLK